MELCHFSDTLFEPAYGGSGRRGNDVHPVHRIDLADFRTAAFAQLQPQLSLLGERVFCRLSNCACRCRSALHKTQDRRWKSAWSIICGRRFTIVGAVYFNKQPSKWWIVIGFVLSFLGIATVLGGDVGLSVSGIYHNVRTNPGGYIMAFADAVFWAAYCTLTARVKAEGSSVGFFFALVSILLWIEYFLSGLDTLNFDAVSLGYAVAAAACMGLGYAVWNIGISRGNLTVLAGASYFIPVLSAVVSSFVISAPLSMTFLEGGRNGVLRVHCVLVGDPGKTDGVRQHPIDLRYNENSFFNNQTFFPIFRRPV